MTVRHELRQATDETIEQAVAVADPMVLRSVLYYLTGDERMLHTRTQMVPFAYAEIPSVVDPPDVGLVQDAAVQFLKSLRDSGAVDCPPGPEERLTPSMRLAAGIDIPEHQLDMWREQTALNPWARAPEWSEAPPERRTDFSVLVIGAGMGGLNAAVHLRREGLRFTVLEKNSEVGGTWHENRYPGARVDNPSRVYSHLVGADYPWSSVFGGQPENERYFNWLVDRFDLRDAIEFRSEVESLVWHEDDREWEALVRSPSGARTVRANAVITSVGFLSRPQLPTVPGMDEFTGRSFHTARWPEDLDLAGKRVAVIGSGATGYQVVPELARSAGHTYLFQRTPSWCWDVPGYLAQSPPQALWLDRNFPYYTNFTRLRMSMILAPQSLARMSEVDPEWRDPHTRSVVNKMHRDDLIEKLTKKFAGQPELVAKMVPTAPPMSSRPVLVDSDYNIYDAILRDDVTLVTDGIDQITPHGIRTATGEHLDLDVIVYATGYRAHDFLWPIEVRGRGGRSINQLWEIDGPRAYLGTMLPGFPNFFMIYGPNMNPFSGMGTVDFHEMVTRFALECIFHLVETDRGMVEVTEDAYWRFNAELDRRDALKIYSNADANTYYQSRWGRCLTNCPIDGDRMWHWLRSPSGRYVGDPVERLPLDEPADVRPYFGADLHVT